MVRVSVKIREGAVSRQVRITAESIRPQYGDATTVQCHRGSCLYIP